MRSSKPSPEGIEMVYVDGLRIGYISPVGRALVPERQLYQATFIAFGLTITSRPTVDQVAQGRWLEDKLAEIQHEQVENALIGGAVHYPGGFGHAKCGQQIKHKGEVFGASSKHWTQVTCRRCKVAERRIE